MEFDSPINVGREVKRGPVLMSPGGNLTSPKNIVNDMKDEEIIFAFSSKETSDNNEISEKLAELDINKNNIISSRQLFGSAISIKLPSTFEDVSIIRQVPDHQEVFVDKESEMSFIIELLSYDDTITDENAGNFYFDDLALCNQAIETIIEDSNVFINNPNFVPKIQEKISICVITGKQSVAKFERKSDSIDDMVQICLVILRLKSVGTDFLISLNSPLRKTDTISSINLSIKQLIQDDIQSENPVILVMKNALNSLEIHDWSLFA